MYVFGDNYVAHSSLCENVLLHYVYAIGISHHQNSTICSENRFAKCFRYTVDSYKAMCTYNVLWRLH